MKPRRFFDDIIAQEAWEPIQDQLAAALGLEIHVLGLDGQDLVRPSGQTRYRALLGSAPNAAELIARNRREVVREAGCRGDITLGETLSGRLRFTVPVLYEGEHLATVTGGGVVEEPLSASEIAEIAALWELDPGALTAAASELRVVSREHCLTAGRLIESLLSQIIEAVEQRERARQQAHRLEILAHLGQTVTRSLHQHDVLDAVVEAIPQVMEVTATAVALVDAEQQTLEVQAGRGLSEEFLTARFEPGRGLMGYVVATGEPVNVPDMLLDPRNSYAELDAKEGLRALLATPLRDGNNILGVVAVYHNQPHGFSVSDEWLLETFADYAASAVRNARLYRQMSRAYRELGRATRQMRELQEQLLHSSRLADLGRVASGTAHEMKGPIAGLIGAASAIRDGLGQMSEEDVRETLALMVEGAWQLNRVVQDVNQYARLRPNEESHWEDLADLLSETTRLFKFDLQHRYHDLTVLGADGIEVHCQRDRFKQILLNLLRNAGEAIIGADRAAGRIVLRVATDENGLRLHVEDNGCGIPTDRIERVFEPFYTTKGSTGTGLGLDIVRGIAREWGGDIMVRSEPGAGTTFTITLPPERVRQAVITEHEQ